MLKSMVLWSFVFPIYPCVIYPCVWDIAPVKRLGSHLGSVELVTSVPTAWNFHANLTALWILVSSLQSIYYFHWQPPIVGIVYFSWVSIIVLDFVQMSLKQMTFRIWSDIPIQPGLVCVAAEPCQVGLVGLVTTLEHLTQLTVRQPGITWLFPAVVIFSWPGSLAR